MLTFSRSLAPLQKHCSLRISKSGCKISCSIRPLADLLPRGLWFIVRMNKLIRLLAFVGAFPLAATAQNAKPSVDELLDKTVSNPGGYSQMCDMQFIKRQVPLALYGLTLDTEFELTPETLTKIRERRAEVIPALVKRLEGIDLNKEPVVKEIEFEKDTENMVSSGLDPKYFSQILLKLIIDLNATECIPQLLRLEKEIVVRLEANNADPKKEVPTFQADAFFTVGEEKAFFAEEEKRNGKERSAKEQAEFDAIHKRVQAIVAQRDCLATMLCLLRQERFEPLLKSDLEKSFVAELKKKAKEENLESIKKPADIKEEDAKYVGFDPIAKLPTYPGRKMAEVKYTPEVRQQILEMVKAFESTVPAEKRLGAKGMTENVYVR